jgi:FkbH-like protein
MLSDPQRQELRARIKAAVAARDAAAVMKDCRELLTSGKPADTAFCGTSITQMAGALVEQLGAKRLSTYLVRSVTVEPMLPALTVEAALAGYVLDVQVGGYGSYMDEMLNPQSALAQSGAELVIVMLDLEEIAGQLPGLCADGRGVGVAEELEQSVGRVEQMLRSYRSRHSGRLVMQGCVLPEHTPLGLVGDANLRYSLPNTVGELNRRIASLCNAIPDCVFFDVDQVAAGVGRGSWRDTRLFLASRLPFAMNHFSAYCRALVRSFSVMFRAPRKVLCTDLDNTLWGGVLGEDGPNGIATGSAFPGNCYLSYQRYLKELSARGILLAIVSKNNEADVREAFAMRAADLALTLDDFVGLKISWGEKSEALRELATELSLGLDSFVFVDDNPVECEAIRQRVPEVAIVAASVDEPWTLVERLSAEPFFDAAIVTEDDVHRSQEYKAQTKRSELEHSAVNRDEFLSSLGIVATFVDALDAPLTRSVQLLAKTNQFNLTTRRHSAADVEAFARQEGGLAAAVRVRDRFGDAGVVGLVLARTDGDVCTIDSLLLSCRVIGRGIESALLAFVAQDAVRNGATVLVGEYIATKKNAPCATFYSDHGFQRTANPGEDGSVFYTLDLKYNLPHYPNWLILEGMESNEFAGSTAITT